MNDVPKKNMYGSTVSPEVGSFDIWLCVVLVPLLGDLSEYYQWFFLVFSGVYWDLHLFLNSANFNIYYLLNKMF